MSSLAFAVLKSLADGRFHSGAVIAGQLGCSRTLVWQAVQFLEKKAGLSIFRVRGQGYRLAEPFELLDVVSIRAGLDATTAECLTVAVTEMVDSTNTQLMQYAASQLHGLVLACEMQTAGRGRLGRKWVMKLGGGLTFSLLWRFNRGLSELAGLPLAVGVALARALHSLGVPVTLKWPNDVLLARRKLAGILIELSGEANGPVIVVIGIGLNIELPDDMEQPVGALRQAGIMLGRNALLSLLLNALTKVLKVFNQQGFVAFRDEWMQLSSHQDAPVCLTFSHSSPVEGIARGVAATGALLLETPIGLQAYHIGEVSLQTRT